MAQLSDFNFLMNNMYIVTERANLYKSDLVAQELLDVDLRIEKNSKSPQILIYHTHSHEGFVDTTGVNTSNIVAVGAYLAEVLSSKYGYNVIHCTQSFDEVNGVFDRSKAYTYATPAIEKILENNPTIEVVLDIHRDGLPDDSPKLVTTINGKQTAKVMFFNGISRNDKGEISYLRNPNRHENLAMSFQMKLKALEMYPEFTRKNYIDAYMYNLHLRKRSMLLEVGAQNNTFEEAKNAMEPFAAILNEILQ
jgi:stage II sporulation protein P